jgi:hypothetical protein
MLQDKRDTSLLRDPNSTAHQQPPYAQNWHRSIEPEYLVVVGICTHLGCIPKLEAAVGGSFGANWPGGYFCPCHGSKYDLAGRVFSGVPAPYNLPVPPYHFVGKTVIRIGENPPGSQFDLSSIEQISPNDRIRVALGAQSRRLRVGYPGDGASLITRPCWSRHTLSVTVGPQQWSAIANSRFRAVPTGIPSNSAMTSPGFNPA